MGIKNRPSTSKESGASGIADVLFTKVQQRVLAVLFAHPERSFYANEVIALAGSGTGAVQRELARLEAAGLVTVTRVGRQKHYQANAAAPVYEELRSLVLKTSGLLGRLPEAAAAEPLPAVAESRASFGATAAQRGVAATNNDDAMAIGRQILVSRTALQALVRRYHIRRLALFGSAARGELRPDSDIDLLVEYMPGEAPSLWDAQELQNDFSQLFGGRRVDIASPEILRNPYRRKTIERDLAVLYETA